MLIRKGLDKPQHGDRSFIGGYLPVELKRQAAGVCLLRNITMTELQRMALTNEIRRTFAEQGAPSDEAGKVPA